MYYTSPFHEFFPHQAWKECRVMTILQSGDLPIGRAGKSVAQKHRDQALLEERHEAVYGLDWERT